MNMRRVRTASRLIERAESLRRIAFGVATGFAVVFTFALAVAGWWPR